MSQESLNRQRIRRSLREAEGYLELATLFEDGEALAGSQRTLLADQCIQILGTIDKPGNHLAHLIFLRGQAHRLAERFHLAIPDLQAAWRMVPGNVHTSLALGWCFKRIGQLGLAVDALQTAVALDDSVGIVHYNLACYLALGGQAQRAVAHLARAVELEPLFKRRAATEPDFDRIRNEPDFRDFANAVETRN